MVGIVTTVSSPSTSGSPSERTSVPPLIVVEPLVPDSDAVQVLDTLVAVNTSWPDVLTGPTVAVLVTEPVGPVVPWVLTVNGPVVNRKAGPRCARHWSAPAVTGVADPPRGRVTAGSGAPSGATAGGPPKRLTEDQHP